MRVPAPRKLLARSHSGEYNGGTSGTDESVEAAAAEVVVSRRHRKKASHHRHTSGSSSSSNLLVILLTSGLVFCGLDVLYICKYLAQQDADNNNIVASTDQQQRRRQVQRLPSDFDTTSGAEDPVRKLLQEAVGKDIDPETAKRLPTAEAVASLYGAQAVVLGLETCPVFRDRGNPADHVLAVAGTFNTGTNLLAELLIANCYLPARQKAGRGGGVRWQVLWGKHTPVDDEDFRVHHRTYNDSSLHAHNMFAVTTVRDPYKWMQSMCRHSYGAKWPHDALHCPNLIPNHVDKAMGKLKDMESPVNVTVKYAEFTQQHDSLVGFWNDWNRAYVQAPFPRLMVRFEDLVFHPKQLTTTVCECAGGKLKKQFQYVVDSAKKGAAHGKDGDKTSYVDALVKYGTENGRYKGFGQPDLDYAASHLDPDILRLFGYRNPSSTATTL